VLDSYRAKRKDVIADTKKKTKKQLTR